MTDRAQELSAAVVRQSELTDSRRRRQMTAVVATRATVVLHVGDQYRGSERRWWSRRWRSGRG